MNAAFALSARRLSWIAALAAAQIAAAQTPLGREMTYQGVLSQSGTPISGVVDLTFSLWDASTLGNQIGSTQVLSAVNVVDGLVTAELDFGANAFATDARWLEIQVASPSGGPLTTLAPRQPMTATPFALQTRGIVVANNGNVAIGTDSSTERLTVAAGSDATIRVENLFDGSAALQFAATDQEYEWRMKTTNNMGFFDNTAGGQERLTIDTAGNVGIGRTNPATALDVNGTVTASAFVGDGSGLTGISISDGHSLDAADGSPTDAVFVDNEGFVGIGTTTPAERLHISAGSPELLLEATGSLATGVQFQNLDHAYSIRMTSGEKFVLRDLTAGNVDRLSIDTSGQVDIGPLSVLPTGVVGVGTSTPAYKLDVLGTMRASSGAIKITDASDNDRVVLNRNTVDDVGFIELSGPTSTNVALGYNGTGDRGYVGVRDQTGTDNVALLATAIGGQVDARNPAGQDRATMFVGSDGIGRVQTFDANGNFNVTVGVGVGANHGGVSVYGDAGTVAAAVYSNLNGGLVDARNPTGQNRGRVYVDAEGAGKVEAYGANGNLNVRLGHFDGTPNDGLVAVFDSAGTRQIAAFVNSNGEGEIECDVLQLFGGSDIAEPFNVNAGTNGVPPVRDSESATNVQAGMVVSIDPANPGELRLATSAYDPTVAGVISGAGGVKPGMTLQQPGTIADGKHPVAMTGRAWCWVDTGANGPVRPGDLLTTSDTPGHAMKATDRERAFGTSIGKAMTALDSGRGLVLVLVNLQ